MYTAKDMNSLIESGRPSGEEYAALKNRLRWRIRRARWMREEQARIQSKAANDARVEGCSLVATSTQ